MHTPPIQIISSVGSSVGQASIDLTMKAAIWARKPGLPGQYFSVAQPVVMLHDLEEKGTSSGNALR